MCHKTSALFQIDKIYINCAIVIYNTSKIMNDWEEEEDMLKGPHKGRHRKDWLQLKE